MSKADAIGAAYLICASLFIIGLKRLSSPATARSGNQIAAVGMAIAIVATLFDERVVTYEWIILGALVGGIGGAIGAQRVKMTAMPQMVALFNGFGGGAAALVAFCGLPRHRRRARPRRDQDHHLDPLLGRRRVGQLRRVDGRLRQAPGHRDAGTR